MAHLHYMPGDPRLVDQLVCELKSKGIFDQFRKECIADVDTRPAYQNLRQRVESSVATFLSRQIWKPDLNKNQLREKLRKHLLDGNYLEQGVERIVDQVVNPKVASVFIPQVEDLVYNYLGIPRKKASGPETSNGKSKDLLPTDLEAVSPGSVKSNEDKEEAMDTSETVDDTMDVDDKPKVEIKEDSVTFDSVIKEKEESRLSGISELTIHDSDVSIDKNTTTIPLPAEEIKLENIPAPENSPPNIKNKNIDLEKIDLPKEPNLSTDIPLPDEMPKVEGDSYFKPVVSNTDDDDTSSDSSLRRNMSPLTPIRNYNNENSCDAQQAFEQDSDGKGDEKKEPNTFRFTIESKSTENSSDGAKPENKEDPASFQFNTQPTNTFNTPLYDDSSNSNNLQIDYESDANSKAIEKVAETDQNSGDSLKKERKDEKKSSHKTSHSSRDSNRHSSSKDKKSDSKHSSSRDSSRHDKKSKEDKSKLSHRERTSDKSDKKDSRDSSKHRSSSSHKSSSHKDSKQRSSSSSKHSSKDDKKSSSSQRDKDKSSSEKSKDRKDSKSSRDKERKSSSKKSDEKENKDKKEKEKKEADDHYSLSGRGNPNRRSTDRDSNDGSSSSKGSHNPSHAKSSESKKDSKTGSKSGNTSSSGDSASPSDNVEVHQAKNITQTKPIVRVETHLETPVSTPPRLPFVPDVTLKKPRFAANLKEAKQMIKMRKFLEEEQKRMNQEAALLLEFQANVRPSLSQVYSSIPGPELEFACVSNRVQPTETKVMIEEPMKASVDTESEVIVGKPDEIAETLIAMHQEDPDLNKTQVDDSTAHRETKENGNDAILETLTGETKIIESVKLKNVGEKGDVSIKSEVTKSTTDFEVTVITEELSESEESTKLDTKKKVVGNVQYKEKESLKYFGENEKYNAEIEKDKFSYFLKKYIESVNNNKLHLINCDTYEENLIRDVSETFGDFEIVNYYKNGYLNKAKNIVKNVNVANEIILPTLPGYNTPIYSPVFSPVKSECSFELSSDYDAKLEEMVSKASKQQIMEIILGTVESPSKMPLIDYCMDSNIEENPWKRKITEVENNVNNNRQVLTPNKMRKLSGSDQISSTTEDSEETLNNTRVQTKSKYLGKARRVGLPKPKRTNLPNSPSSDKSVENYEQTDTPNGKIKNTPRSKVQRYDTSDLYKPKLHYLSRRNNIS